MTVPTNAFDTYETVGRREDLTNTIFDISPTETPFLSGAGRGKAMNTLHEWQTDSLAAVADNKAIEGDDATGEAVAATTRLSNYTQISDKVVVVTGTNEAADAAGRKREMAYQMAKRAKELKRDMENALVGLNNAKAVGSASVARELASVQSWIATNTSAATDGSDPTGDGTDARSDGTQRAFTEALLKTVLQAVWNSGGDPGVLMVGGFNKQAASGFAVHVPDVSSNTLARRSTENARAKRLTAAVDVYESDFGVLQIIPNRFSRARDALVLDMEYWKIAFHRPFNSYPLGKSGDNERRQMIVEYTLEACNEAASGIVADLTTS